MSTGENGTDSMRTQKKPGLKRPEKGGKLGDYRRRHFSEPIITLLKIILNLL